MRLRYGLVARRCASVSYRIRECNALSDVSRVQNYSSAQSCEVALGMSKRLANGGACGSLASERAKAACPDTRDG